MMKPSRSKHTDARGVPVSTDRIASIDAYEKALWQFQSYFGDPTATLAGALHDDPEFILGHIFSASAMLMMSERQYLPAVHASLDQAAALAHKANDRERILLAATRDLAAGRWHEATAKWDRVLAEHPRDALALQCAHLIDFFVGDAVNLRDRTARVLGHWNVEIPGYSYMLGLHAFGLEECNEFERAETAARTALAIERRDAWSVHALTHVMEMQNRYDEGCAFLESTAPDWSQDNGFAFHNWWHLALFYMEREDFTRALDLFDERVFNRESDVSMELLDATALLWRLHLQDVDVSGRWMAVANRWAMKTGVENGYYAFNDFHAVVALAGAGRLDAARAVLAALGDAAKTNPPATRAMAAEVGIPACSAIIAFAEQRYAEVIEILSPLRARAHRFGGSNAQRDILAQTLLVAALRSGHTGLATNLLHERAVHKPASPLTRRWRTQCAQAVYRVAA